VLAEVSLVFFEVLFYEPLRKDVFLLLDLGSLQRIIIAGTARIGDILHGVTFSVEDKVHHQATYTAIAICERVYGDEF